MRTTTGMLLLMLMLGALPIAAAADYQELTWDDLMPPGEWERYDDLYFEYLGQLTPADLVEGSPGDVPIQFGTFNVVEELDGRRIRLPGFVLPFDFTPNRRVQEFLLVPYFGACIHVPPPPPNQIVYVTTDDAVAFGDLWAPVWLHGVLRTEKNVNGLGDAAYTLHLESWEPYDF